MRTEGSHNAYCIQYTLYCADKLYGHFSFTIPQLLNTQPRRETESLGARLKYEPATL